MANLLIRPIFLNPQDGKERRGYHSHLQNSTNKPLCALSYRGFGVGKDVSITRWIEAQGTEPTCPICQRIAKRGGKAA